LAAIDVTHPEYAIVIEVDDADAVPVSIPNADHIAVAPAIELDDAGIVPVTTAATVVVDAGHPGPITAAILDPCPVVATTAVVLAFRSRLALPAAPIVVLGKGPEPHFLSAGTIPAAAIRARGPDLSISAAALGTGLAIRAAALGASLPVATAALGAGFLAAAAPLSASLLAAAAALDLGRLAAVLASSAALCGQRGRNGQRRCAGSKHPLHHGYSPSGPKTAQKGARSAV
jgi:hypothetical protein